MAKFTSEHQPTRRGRTGRVRTKTLPSTKLPHLYLGHRRAEGVMYRRHFALLGDAYDLSRPLARIVAGMAASTYVLLHQISLQLSAAQASGKGNPRLVERLRKRRALEWMSYADMLDRLAAPGSKKPSASALLDRVHAAIDAEGEGE